MGQSKLEALAQVALAQVTLAMAEENKRLNTQKIYTCLAAFELGGICPMGTWDETAMREVDEVRFLIARSFTSVCFLMSL